MDITAFNNRICFEPNTGCWLWTGRLNHDGYGSLHRENNDLEEALAHRYSFRIFKGPVGKLSVLHKCDVRCCVNPDHLFLGTQIENISDMDKKGRRKPAKGASIGSSKLTDDKALVIKKLYSTGNYKQIEIAALFGVQRSVVSAIANERTWTHVEGIEKIKRHPKSQGGIRHVKIHPVNHPIIIEAYANGFSDREIAQYYNVAYQSILGIRRKYL